jgi:hypothetical protein
LSRVDSYRHSGHLSRTRSKNRYYFLGQEFRLI